MTPFVWQSNKAVLFYFPQNSLSEIRFITGAQRGGAFSLSKEKHGFHSGGDGWHLEVVNSRWMGPGPGFWLLCGEWVEVEGGEAGKPVGRSGGCPGEEGCRCRLRRGEGNWSGKIRVDGACRRKQWHPTPILLPGKSHGRRSLEGCSPWGRWGSDTTDVT